jgi:hypothetical protein
VGAAAVERKRKIVPPVYLFMTLAAMAALHRFMPIAQLLTAPYTHAAGCSSPRASASRSSRSAHSSARALASYRSTRRPPS